MKTLRLVGVLLAVLMTFGLTSCDDENEVIISQLTGMWVVKEPVLADDFVTTYTFHADKTCEIYTGSPASNGVPIYCTVVISEDNSLITLSNEERHYTEQYNITKLSAGKMEWVNATPEDGNSNKKLEKIEK